MSCDCNSLWIRRRVLNFHGMYDTLFTPCGMGHELIRRRRIIAQET